MSNPGRKRDERESPIETDPALAPIERRYIAHRMSPRERFIVTAVVAHSASQCRLAGMDPDARAFVDELREEIQKPEPMITDAMASRAARFRLRLDRWKVANTPCPHPKVRLLDDGRRRCRQCGEFLDVAEMAANP
jgi:hypothetical protein